MLQMKAGVLQSFRELSDCLPNIMYCLCRAHGDVNFVGFAWQVNNQLVNSFDQCQQVYLRMLPSQIASGDIPTLGLILLSLSRRLCSICGFIVRNNRLHDFLGRALGIWRSIDISNLFSDSSRAIGLAVQSSGGSSTNLKS